MDSTLLGTSKLFSLVGFRPLPVQGGSSKSAKVSSNLGLYPYNFFQSLGSFLRNPDFQMSIFVSAQASTATIVARLWQSTARLRAKRKSNKFLEINFQRTR
jgi:hypothetical protein